MVKENPGITYNEMARLTGKHRDTISQHLKALVKNAYIQRIGSDKTGHWEILTPPVL